MAIMILSQIIRSLGTPGMMTVPLERYLEEEGEYSQTPDMKFYGKACNLHAYESLT